MAAAWRVGAAITLLLKYDPDAVLWADYDELQIDGPPPDKMTPEDVVWMQNYGFTYMPQFKSWHRNV